MARKSPFEEIDRLFEEMERTFGEMRRSWSNQEFSGLRNRPGIAVDLHREDDEYALFADLPGFEKEEIDLTFEGDSLVVDAVHEVGEESATGEFSRTRRVHERVSVPDGVDEEAISASYRNGVLEVRLPLQEGRESHDIDISD